MVKEVAVYLIRFQEGEQEPRYLEDEGAYTVDASLLPHCWVSADYEKALNVVSIFQKLDLPFLEENNAPAAELKFRLLCEMRNFVNVTGQALVSAAMVTFKKNVFIELCSTRVPESWEDTEEEDTAENYKVNALVRYPLGYTLR
jgi:hypothetical protein